MIAPSFLFNFESEPISNFRVWDHGANRALQSCCSEFEMLHASDARVDADSETVKAMGIQRLLQANNL